MAKHDPLHDPSAILQQMAQLQSMERGTLSEEYREHPDGSGGKVRLGPYFKHQVWEAGSNKSRRVPSDEAPQLREDIENHQRFTELADAYVELTVEKTRAKRAKAKSGADPDAKKKLQEQIAAESFQETEAFLQLARQRLAREQSLGSCPQWLEEELRAALNRDACGLLQRLFCDPELFPDAQPARPMEKRYAGRLLCVQTLFGTVELRRSYYHHYPSHTGRAPLDERLGLVDSFSPAVARMMCQAASRSGSYAEASGDLLLYAGVAIETHAFDRLVNRVAPTLSQALETLPAVVDVKPIPVFYVSGDGTGVPMRREELEGRAGRQSDGSAKTREAKLGCVFTQTITDEDGQPLRDPDSTSYVGTFASSLGLGILLRQEAMRRGLSRAQKVVFLGDGAAWVWETARLNFPGAVEILDFYHAAEHVAELASLLFGCDETKRLQQQDQWIDRMKETNPDAMLQQARRLLEAGSFSREETEKINGKIAYFENQAGRTRYGEFRAKGYFIGSGVIEAGCKCVVGRRLKQSGMFWSEEGAENLLRLRCLVLGPHHSAAWVARAKIMAQRQAKARQWTPSELPAAA